MVILSFKVIFFWENDFPKIEIQYFQFHNCLVSISTVTLIQIIFTQRTAQHQSNDFRGKGKRYGVLFVLMEI